MCITHFQNFPFFVCVLLSMVLLMYVVCMCTCAYMHGCVWKTEIDVMSLPQMLSTLFIETRSLTEPLARQIRQQCPVNLAICFILVFQFWDYRHVLHIWLFFVYIYAMNPMYAMTELGFSGKHFANWIIISQAPVSTFQSGLLEEVAITISLNLEDRW